MIIEKYGYYRQPNADPQRLRISTFLHAKVSTVLRHGAAIININPDFNIFPRRHNEAQEASSCKAALMLVDLLKDRITAGS